MPDDTSAAVVKEFEAESWPLEAAAASLHQVIEGFHNGDTRPLVIGDGDKPVLVVLAIADLADFRARIAELLGNPVDAGWLRSQQFDWQATASQVRNAWSLAAERRQERRG